MSSDNTPTDLPNQPHQTPETPAPATREEPVYDTAPSSTSMSSRQAAEETGKVKGSLAGGTWAALIVGAVLLILLIVFILQNPDPVEVNMFTWTWEFPAAIAYLISAIIGALIMAMVGGWRMFELRRQVKKAGRH